MKNSLIFPTLLSLLFTGIQACGQSSKSSTQYHYTAPQYNFDSLYTGNAADVGIDSSAIRRVTRLILNDSISNVHSMLIFKNDKLIYEQYFAGKDQKHGKKLGLIDHSADQLHDCRSISKSVVPACVGIALKQQLIKCIDDSIGRYFPEIKDSLMRTITVRQLLTMTSGLKWREIGSYGSFFNSETQMDISFNPVKYILHRDITAIPGTEWNYSAGNTQLLAEIIYRTSGMTIDKYADKFLFKPLGIDRYEWANLTFRHIPAAASGLRLTSRDMLKFGMLYLDSGNWKGRQILDSAWVKESFSSSVKRPDLSRFGIPAGGYGFQFWTSSYSLNNRMIDIAEAKGNGGQSIFVCRSLNLLLITTGGNYNKADSNPYVILTKYILPAVKD